MELFIHSTSYIHTRLDSRIEPKFSYSNTWLSSTASPKASGIPSSTVIIVVLSVMTVLCLLGGWLFYGYKNPNSSSGRWLIQVS